ncbi:Hypothetical predicted protein [Lecanosticta acicola]|uniref:Uncharacterized protein n=1 Tax=Lecanosticta acicola TaxID=111012 RepID=A0AAI9EAV8_9PEZI|nr:Hypothetical predicted protein [Lecanosticta acicola]
MTDLEMTDPTLPNAKRACHTVPTSAFALPHCLHCKSYSHTWSRCPGGCIHCSKQHPRRRCEKLPLVVYTPGGFTILNGIEENHITSWNAPAEVTLNFTQPIPEISATKVPPAVVPTVSDDINPARAAMIAITPAMIPPKCNHAVGPRKTASNLIPLGKANRLQRSNDECGNQEIAASKMQGVYSKMDKNKLREGVQKQAHKDKAENDQEELAWTQFCQSVYSTVRGAKKDHKVQNNGSDAMAVDERIRGALDLLKPLMIRPSRK